MMPIDKSGPCSAGNHEFEDGFCVHCDALPPYPGARWDGDGPPPAPKPHNYEADSALKESCLWASIIVLVVGAALLAIGFSAGFETLGSARDSF